MHLHVDFSVLRRKLTWVVSTKPSLISGFPERCLLNSFLLPAYHWQMFSCACGSLNMRQYSRFTHITNSYCTIHNLQRTLLCTGNINDAAVRISLLICRYRLFPLHQCHLQSSDYERFAFHLVLTFVSRGQ